MKNTIQKKNSERLQDLINHSAALIALLMFLVCVSAPAVHAQNMSGTWASIPDQIWIAMQNKSWHSRLACPKREKLALLTIPYLDFEGRTKTGRLIAARDVADDLLQVFETLYRVGFQIQRMELVHKFGGDDSRSMRANNTSAFNCRRTSNGTRLSEHSYGLAIDINPVQNPYVRRNITQPAAGKSFDTPEKRRRHQPGLIRKNDVVVRAFAQIGWKWGGNWRTLKDYQHFSKSGR